MAAPGETFPSSPCRLGAWVEDSVQFRACPSEGRLLVSVAFYFSSPRGLEQGHHGGDTTLIVSSSGSQPEAISFPVGHVEMSGDIFHCDSREAVARSIKCVEATAAVKGPVMH